MKNNRSNFLANKIFVRKMEEEGNFMGEMFEEPEDFRPKPRVDYIEKIKISSMECNEI
jgi:hypothetical protein